MGRKISIYAGEPLDLVLVGHEKNRSGRINVVCDRYLQIVANDAPTLSLEQWSAVCDALDGYWLKDEDSVRFAWAEIVDADLFDGLGEKWGIDAKALAETVQRMTHGQRVALVEIVERFWKRTDLPTAEALSAAGAKLTAG